MPSADQFAANRAAPDYPGRDGTRLDCGYALVLDLDPVDFRAVQDLAAMARM